MNIFQGTVHILRQHNFGFFLTHPLSSQYVSHGNTGCGVFKRGVQNYKNQHTQRKLLNFENWVNGGVSSSAKI